MSHHVSREQVKTNLNRCLYLQNVPSLLLVSADSLAPSSQFAPPVSLLCRSVVDFRTLTLVASY